MDIIKPAVPASLVERIIDGHYAGQILIGGQAQAIIVPPKALSRHDPAPWNDTYKSVDDATSYFDGLVNTLAMAKAGSKLAQWALDNGLYLPAVYELDLVYRAFKPTTDSNVLWRCGENPLSVPVGLPYTTDFPSQTPVEAFREGNAEAFDTSWYWSSTQHPASSLYAYCQHFEDGNQGGSLKGDELAAVAVRRLEI